MRDLLHDLEFALVELFLSVRVEACLGDLLDGARRLRAPVNAREDSSKAALAKLCHQLIVIAEGFYMLEFHLLFEAVEMRVLRGALCPANSLCDQAD